MLPRHRFVLFFLFLALFGFQLLLPTSRSQGTNHSLLLNGTTAYIDVPYNANLNITGALTIEAWVKTAGTGVQQVVERGDWWQNQMSYDLLLVEGKVRLDIMQTNGSYAAVMGSTAMSLNAWHHIAGVYDGSQMRVYVDGVLNGTAAATMAPGNNATGLRIGKSSFLYYPNYFNGRIDEVRVSNAVLYSSNFTPSAHLAATVSTKGLWKFDGQTANDWSSSGANGSLQGSATYSTDAPVGTNAAPTISLNDPLNNTNFAAGANVVIDASASDADGAIAQVEFFQGATLLGSDSTAPYTFTWNNVTAGSYAISARATDDLGATAATTSITITVMQAGGDRSLLFNGTSSYVDVPYNANLNLTGALTIEAWVKTSSTAVQQVIERGDWWQNQMSYQLTLVQSKVRLDIMQTAGSYTAVAGSTAMSLNAWHHIAGVYDGSQMRVYLDGVLDGTAAATMAPGNNTTGLRIGKSSFLYYPNYFNGRIDEVRVSNAAIYSSNFTPSAHLTATASTRGLWKFDGETSNDASASAANGSLQGGAVYSTDVPIGAGGGGQLPVAVANGPYTAQLGQAVSLSSSGSFDPDGTISSYHWNFGDGTSANTANVSHTYQSSGLFTATLTVTDNAGLRNSATASVTITGASEARLDPLNQTGGTGENALSRNFNWKLPLLSLPGRGGMDLGLTLAYNSLVWTKSGSYISFDDDHGLPSPGFRLGFPVIQPVYFNAETGKNTFLLISPDGGRTELRQVGTSALYESADSSHLLLDAATMILRTTDGTQLSYAWLGAEYNCTQIKDRQGNYLTINYTPTGRIDTIVDTLARSIKFNYDAAGALTSITQLWNQGAANQVTHTWASFTYTNTTIQTNFTGLSVYGPASIKALSSVTLADGSHSDFSYTSWGQVWKVSGYAADNHLLGYRSYNLPQTAANAQTDCPRFTERRDWAQYFNGDTDGTVAANEEVVTLFAVPVSDSWTMPDGTPQSGTRAQVTEPDGTSSKLYFIGAAGTTSGWRRSLPALVNTYDSAGALQRQAMTTWTQDNTAVSYQLNPRVTETNIYDPAGNRARAQLTYQQFTFTNGTSCQLPRDTYEYAANAAAILRSTRTDYNPSTVYSDRRILGLVSEQRLYEGDVNNGGVLMSKVAFSYDEGGSLQGTDAPVQHDNTNYSAAFVTGRANLSSVKRYDVTNTAVFTTSSTKYNTAGAVVSSKDALNHEVTISYADSFSDGNNTRNTLAYPSTLTDPDGYSSTTKYHFDFGAITYTRTPQPNTTSNLPGPEQTFTFDALGRLQQQTNQVNGAYTRFEYPTSANRIDTYTTIQDGLGEAHSFQLTDGAGRVIATAVDHPGSVGGFSGRRTIYDAMGRIIKTSNPTETNASGAPSQWTTAGDDAAAGWIYAQQTYDWKGRPLVTTNQDGTTTTASYAGCGCAGGEVITLTDEGTIDAGVAKKRQQKIYKDVLGRVVKTELLNWEGGSVYSTTVNTYNARDQITQVRQYAGPQTSSTYQDTTMTFDGYGRPQTRHLPQENSGTGSTWTYNADDSVNTVTDARGAVTTLGYAGTNRGLVKTITHTLSGSPQLNLSYSYDAVGNRILMTDNLGAVSYGYDQLSRMTSETRAINGVGTFTLNYTYNLAGELASFTSFGNSISYARDLTGRLAGVSGSPFGGITQYVSNIKYRAWGGRRELTYGNNHIGTTQYNNRLLPTSYSLSNAMTRSYSYFADGRLRTSSLSEDGSFNRTYEHDLAGRLESDSTPTTFAQNLSYDVWGNATQSNGWHWSQFINSTATYTNNRNSNWQYNAAGQVTSNQDNVFQYDAAGRTNHVWTQGGVTDTGEIFYDGDGQVVRTSNSALYSIRSTVLGGRVVAEVLSTGQRVRGFVYAEGEEVLAIQNADDRVLWEHRDPAEQSVRVAESSGTVVDQREETASGAKIEPQDPYPANPNFTGADTDGQYPFVGTVGKALTGCNRDGILIPDCSWIFVRIHSNELAEAGARASALKLLGYEVATYNGRLLKHFGQNLDRAIGEALEQGHGTVIRNWQVNDSAFAGSYLFSMQSNAQGQQKTVTENDPALLQGENNGTACGIVVRFAPGTSYPDKTLPDGKPLLNGPSTMPSPLTGLPSFGLGFSVSGWVDSGGIGRIGSEKEGVVNPDNPKGRWTIDQETSAWIGIDGKVTDERATFSDIKLGVPHKADGNTFSWYDHPGDTQWPANYSRFENHIVKVYKGKTVCEVKFHFIQHGNTIHWGPGLL